jgi:hypothetical protein
VTKSGSEIMEILEAYDLTGCARSAAQLAGTDRKTVLRYVALRDGGSDPVARQQRPRGIDEIMDKVFKAR